MELQFEKCIDRKRNVHRKQTIFSTDVAQAPDSLQYQIWIVIIDKGKQVFKQSFVSKVLSVGFYEKDLPKIEMIAVSHPPRDPRHEGPTRGVKIKKGEVVLLSYFGGFNLFLSL